MTKAQYYRWLQMGDRRKQKDELPPEGTNGLRRRTIRAAQRPTVKRKSGRRAPKHAFHPA